MSEIADFLKSKTCDDHRRCGTCGCRSRNGSNPCEITAAAAKSAAEGINLVGVLTRVGIHKCANAGRCSHKGCIKTMRLEKQIQLMMA